MKTFKILVSALALGTALWSPAIKAQGADNPPPHEGGPGRKGGDRVKMLIEELSLTDAQTTQVKAIFAEQMAAGKQIREDSSLSEDDKRAKSRELMQASMAKVRALLTPEQQVKFDALPKPGGRGARKGDKKP